MRTDPDSALLTAVSLEARILEAEARLIAREAAVQQQWESLVTQARRAVEPKRLLLPLVGGVSSLTLLWRLLRRAPPRASNAHPQSQQQANGPARFAAIEGLMMGLIPSLYPLLPARWRSRVSPSMVTTTLSLCLPLLQKLLSRTHGPAGTPPTTAASVDLERYAGLWYEIARLPTSVESRCAGQPTARYELRGDGVAIINRCRDKKGDTLVSEGVGRIVPDSGGAKLKVSFVPAWLQWLPMVWADYWILDRDEDYTLALVGTPSREALWLLARTPTIAPEALQALVERARVLGYDVSRLQLSTENA